MRRKLPTFVLAVLAALATAGIAAATNGGLTSMKQNVYNHAPAGSIL